MSSPSSDRDPARAGVRALQQRDLLSLSPDEQDRDLASFEARLQQWAIEAAAPGEVGGPTISVEIPVYKGGWIIPAVESVLYQTSAAWTLALRWDGGDEQSRRVLEALDRLGHARIQVHFGENRGIAYNRRFLTAHSSGDYILPVDDDDMLSPDAVETFLAFARRKPWSGIVRAKRAFINEVGEPVHADPWFAFEPRHFQHGMVQDVSNHCQPMLISRAAYGRTAGWEGFQEFRCAGEDCDIFIKIEEIAPIELLDAVLYYYRLSDRRTSLVITDTAAYEMWRRLADQAIARIGVPLTRVNDRPPFSYERQRTTEPTLASIDFVVFESPAVEASSGGAALDETALRLRTAGIDDDAVHVVRATTLGADARNEGFRKTTRPLVCFVRAGVEIERDALETLLRELHERDADLAGPRVLRSDGTIASAAPAFNQDGVPVTQGMGAPHRGRYESVSDVAWLPSTCLLVRREVVNAVAGFEHGASEIVADADFSLKARRRDFRAVYVGSAVALERTPGGAEPTPSAELEWLWAKWHDYPRLLDPLDFGAETTDFRALYERGNALVRDGQLDLAIGAFHAVTAINPNFSWAYHSLGDALFQVERWAEAAQAYREAIARKADVPWSHLHLGNTLSKLERWDEALDAYGQATALDPRIAGAHSSSGHAFLRQSRWEEALAAFERATTIDEHDFWSHYGRGDALSGLERWDDAVDAYQRAIGVRDDMSWAHHHLGDSLAQVGRLEEASAAYRRAIALDPCVATSHTKLGDVLFRLDQFRDAVASYDRAIDVDPHSFWAHYGRADALSSPSLERWAEAIESYERANSLRPDEFWSYYNLGQAHGRLKQWDRAVAAYRQATELDPSRAKAYWKLGGALGEIGAFEEAVAALQRAVALEPDAASSHGSLGNALFEIGRWEEAAAAYRAAIALEPEVAWYRTNLGHTLDRQGQYEEAAEAYRTVIALQPDEPTAHADLGHAISKLERWADAAACFERAIDLDPRPFWSHHKLGYALLRMSRWEDAATVLSRAIAIDAGFCWSHHYLGNALAKLDQWPEAADAFRRAIELEPTVCWSANCLGEMLAKLQRWDEARDAFERALALQPDFVLAAHNLADALLHLGQLEEASHWYRRTSEAFPEWCRADTGQTVQLLEQWIGRLGGEPSNVADAAGDRLLFVFDTDYGELTTAMYMLLGQPLAANATLLLPPRLFVNNGEVLPGRTHLYRSTDDVLRAVDRDRPTVVVIASGYLFSIHDICSPEALQVLVTQLTARGCHVVTTDPFLGLLSNLGTTTHISIDIPANASPLEVRLKRDQDAMLIEHFSKAVTVLHGLDHLYPVHPAGPNEQASSNGIRSIASFNDALLLDTAVGQGALPAAARSQSGKPLWVFVLASRDYELQAAFQGKAAFAAHMVARLEETLEAGRHPVLIAPYSCVRAIIEHVEARGTALSDRVTLTTFCSFRRFSALLLGAEYVFYWNALSHSMFLRLFNGLPTFLFDRGHLVRNVTPLYERIVSWYYQGWEPVYLDPGKPLTVDALREPAECYRAGAQQISRLLRRAPSPVRMLDELRRIRPADGVVVSA